VSAQIKTLPEAAPAKEQLMNEFGVAQMLNMSVRSVRRWRLFGQGPRYLKIGASVRYRPEDVRAWLESQPTGGTNISGETT
jgi:predicted DNA-binding transcriptional regulator AlpA